MKVYAVLRRWVNSEGWSVGSDHLEKIYSTEEKANAYIDTEKKINLFQNIGIGQNTQFVNMRSNDDSRRNVK